MPGERHEPVPARRERTGSERVHRHTVRLRPIALAAALMAIAPALRSVAQTPLASAKSLSCVFPVYATGTWTKGEPEASVKPAQLSFRFEAIDTQDGTAEVVGPFGPSHIIARLADRYLHFMQIFTAGPLYTTTVFDRQTRDGKLQAVHTRHEYTEVSLPGFTSRPEQYYGECEVGR